MLAPKKVEHFSVDSKWLRDSKGLRLDASFYNPRLAHALETLRKSGMALSTLGEVTEKIFIPPRFKRIYVDKEHGIPFLQGSHVVHFQPAEMKYLSRTAHKKIQRWIIKAGWVLVTCSGTVGRVMISLPEWNGWAASQHILRIIPKQDYPAGYIYAFLSSPMGQAQLTAQIYGAVVDELTEEQARSILIPIATNERERQQINHINDLAVKAMKKRQEASLLASEAVAGIDTLIPQPQEAEPGLSIPGVTEFEKFQNFTQMLLAVPKHEIDEPPKAKAKQR
jgi:type I restriction enzyme, S subunit